MVTHFAKLGVFLLFLEKICGQSCTKVTITVNCHQNTVSMVDREQTCVRTGWKSGYSKDIARPVFPSVTVSQPARITFKYTHNYQQKQYVLRNQILRKNVYIINKQKIIGRVMSGGCTADFGQLLSSRLVQFYHNSLRLLIKHASSSREENSSP